jgi:hypothetical protein
MLEYLASRWALDVERDAALVAVEELPDVVGAVGVRDEAVGYHGAKRIAARTFDLDDLRAPVGERGCRRWNESVPREVEDVDAVQRSGHAGSLPADPGTALAARCSLD